MIAVTIGRTFLKAYNEKFSTSYGPQDFFDEVFFELFFNSTKYMQWVKNSPFVQGVSRKEGSRKGNVTPEERLARLEELHKKIGNGNRDASVGIGFPASDKDKFQTTSGQVTNLNLKMSEEDLYYSWIGSGFAIEVDECSIFFDNSILLLDLFEGWSIYRNFLEDETLKEFPELQISRWNARWLRYMYTSMIYESIPDLYLLQNEGFLIEKNNKIQINNLSWTELFFSLSKKFSGCLIGYIFKLGRDTKTYGFFPFYLKDVFNLVEIYQNLFGKQDALSQAKDYQRIFGKYNIIDALSLGVLGLRSLEPKFLSYYSNNNKVMELESSFLQQKAKESTESFSSRIQKEYEIKIYYRTYKTWLLAMITKNKKEELTYTEDVAVVLHRYVKRARKNDRLSLLKNELFACKTKKFFIIALTKILQGIKEDKLSSEDLNLEMKLYKELRNRVYLMNTEDFGYFVVLLKFDFFYLDN